MEATGTYTTFGLNVIPNIELERFLLSLGEEAVVLQPDWLRQRISGRLEQAAGNYVTE